MILEGGFHFTEWLHLGHMLRPLKWKMELYQISSLSVEVQIHHIEDVDNNKSLWSCSFEENENTSTDLTYHFICDAFFVPEEASVIKLY